MKLTYETYKGITTIDNIDYHTFYSKDYYITTDDYRIYKFGFDIPLEIKNIKYEVDRYIYKQQEIINNLKIENLLVITEPSGTYFKSYSLLRGIEDSYQFIGMSTSDIEFNICEIRIRNCDKYNDWYTYSPFGDDSRKEYNVFERKLKINRLLSIE